MQRKFYVDTSIWRDYFEDRKNCIRPLGDLAFQFLKMCQRKKYVVLVSDLVSRELLGHYSESRAKEVFASFCDIILHVEISREQKTEAHSLWVKSGKRFPFYDVLHSIVARDNGAAVISRDRHFSEIGVVDCLLPEEAD